MSTVILLSSSPPQVFARSPTPADSSSPSFPSVNNLLKDSSPSRKRFKTTTAQRDGFTPGFSSARRILAEKDGAKNQILTASTKTKFIMGQAEHRTVNEVENPSTTRAMPPTKDSRSTAEVQADVINNRTTTAEGQAETPIFIQVTKKDIRSKSKPKASRKRSTSPLLLQRAASRKLDWTPPKTSAELVDVDSTLLQPIAFPTSLLGSFGFSEPELISNEYAVLQDKPTKRRKLEQPPQDVENLDKVAAVPVLESESVKPSKGRNKSPAKKALTITGLATANYATPEEEEVTPMMQYLTATQAQLGVGIGQVDDLNAEAKKIGQIVKKIKKSKKPAPSRLLSPSSALRSFEGQEAIFGSASQLAKDESPTFLRDTIEALRQSETNLLSDPVSPLQATQAISIELTTPQQGTTRFKRTRNLWAAAGRDEDNALLHIDSVDLSNTPAMRNAFAGKDVMIEPGMKRPAFRPDSRPLLRGGGLISTIAKSSEYVDIDDIMTPGKTFLPGQVAAMHTSTKLPSPPRKSPTRSVHETTTDLIASASIAAPPAAKQRKKTTKKPHYAGWTDHELKKQISAYGFKAVKKREKMVELLDRCWEEKHGTGTATESEPVSEPVNSGIGYNNILSNVHDVSARPVPKVIKPKVVRKKKADNETTASAKKPRAPRKKKDPDTDGVTKPKPKTRKKKKSDGNQADEKVPRKAVRKANPKTSVLSKEIVSESEGDDQETHTILASTGVNTFGDIDEESVLPHAPTPPPTLPSATALAVLAASNEPILVGQTSNETEITSIPQLSTPASTPPLPDLQVQVTKAIMHQSSTALQSNRMKSGSNSGSSIPPRRNHQLDPTWHEKILLYDPIILEDLALWLNTEGLSAVGEDREVSALEVRTWCEGKGICCLWKGGWRGNKVAATAD